MTLDKDEKKELIEVINSNTGKINWTALTVVITVLLAIVGWCISVESRLTEYKASMNLNERVKNLEELLVPVLVDYKVKKEVEKLEAERAVRRNSMPKKSSSTAMPAPTMAPMPSMPPEEPISMPKIEASARDWAESQVRQSPRYKDEK